MSTLAAKLGAGDDAGAVDELVAVWAKVPSTRIAELVTTLSARLPRETAPAKVGEREERWLALAETRSHAVVPTLLSFEWPVHPREAKARMQLLQQFAPDPRIAHAIRELWLAGRYRTAPGRPFWNQGFRLLLGWNDPGVAAALAVKTGIIDEYIVVDVTKRLKGKPLPAEPELPADIAALLDEHGTRPRTADRATRASLLAAIYADPTDDDARLVYADFLNEEGDARGELIQLMHAVEHGRGSAKMEARIRALLRTAGKQWLDGLGTMGRHPAFRCGFASKLSLEGKIDPSVPAWATIETLVCGTATGVTAALRHPNLKHLRHLDGVPADMLGHVVKVDRELERLGISPGEDLAPVPESKLRVRHLAVFNDVTYRRAQPLADVLRWFDRSAFRRDARVLEVSGVDGARPIRPWLAANDRIESFRLWPRVAHRYPLDMLGQENLELRLDRDASLHVLWHAPTFEARDDKALREAVAELGGPFEKVHVTPPPRMSRARRDAVVTSVRTATKAEPEVS